MDIFLIEFVTFTSLLKLESLNPITYEKMNLNIFLPTININILVVCIQHVKQNTMNVELKLIHLFVFQTILFPIRLENY